MIPRALASAAAACATAATSGCMLLPAEAFDHTDELTLAELADGVLSVEQRDGELVVQLGRARGLAGLDCVRVGDDVVVAIDGALSTVVSRGEFVPRENPSQAAGCIPPTFTTPIGQLLPTTLVQVRDSAPRMTAEIAAVVALREFRAPDPIRAGTDAVITWSVPTDTLDPQLGVWWQPDAGDWLELAPERIAVLGDEVHLSLPADLATGPGDFAFSSLQVAYPALRTCDGVAVCEVPNLRAPQLPVTILPAAP